MPEHSLIEDEEDHAFEAAAAHVASLAGGGTLPDEALLQLYGLYKQATCGPCLSFRPSFFDRKARSKWAAWQAHGKLPAVEAKRQYTALVSSLCPEWDRQKGSGGRGGPGGPVFSSLANADGVGGVSRANRLHISASEGDTAAIAALLNDGHDVDARDEDGCTALHWAADRGCTEVVQQLLQRGADIDAQDTDGQTPLHYAALCEQREACIALLRAGANAALRDKHGLRPRDVDHGPDGWDIWGA